MDQPAKPRDRFDPGTRSAIAVAKEWVLKFNHTHITPEHIMLGLLDEKHEDLVRGLSRATASPDQIRELVLNHLRPGDQEIPEHLITFSERAKRVIESAREESQRTRSEQIGPGHLLLGLTRVTNTVSGAVLRAVDAHTDSVREALGFQG